MKTEWKSEAGISPSVSKAARRERATAVKSGTELLPRVRDRILRVADNETTR